MHQEKMISLEYQDRKLDLAYTHDLRSGTSVVCLHGLQSNKNMFSVMEELFTHKKYSMIAIDCIGFGKSSMPTDFSYALEDQAAIVDRMIEQLDLQKFFLIGHGMGGMIATLLLNSWRSSILGFVNMEGNFVLEDCGASLPVSQSTFEEFSQTMYPQLQQSLETSTEPSAVQRRQCLRSTPDYAFYGTSKSIVEWSRSEKLLPLFIDSPVFKVFFYGSQNRRKKDILPKSVPTREIPSI